MNFKDYMTEAANSERTIADVLRDTRVIEQSTDGRFSDNDRKRFSELNVEMKMLMNKLSAASNEEIQKNIDEIKKRESSVQSKMIVEKLQKMLQK